MAEESGLKPWEKTPGNRRLDHPDFQDVYETTFAKGTIKEFQVLQTNPIKVASMVKVEVDGQLHDEFIPLFYAPKEGFWDDTEAKATDFDPEQKCFKRAWMSFRCGDEVVILMEKDVPKYVIGFADNLPRIGENIIKIVHPSQWWYDEDAPMESIEWKSFITANIVPVPTPSGYMWGRLTPYPDELNGYYPDAKEPYIPAVSGGNYYIPATVDDPLGPDGNPLGLLTEAEHINRYIWNSPYGDYYILNEWLFGVGPYLFVLIAIDHGGAYNQPSFIYNYELFISCGIYSPDNWLSVIQHLPTHNNNSYWQQWWNHQINLMDFLNYPMLPLLVSVGWKYNDWLSNHITDYYYFRYDGARIYVRPHSRAELVNAGLWPEE